MKKTVDFEDIIGQEHCKRAMEVAACGNHNVLFIGPRKSGKSTMIRALRSLNSHILAGEATPCPCGNFTDPKKECHCTPKAIQNHLRKINGLLYAIHIEVPKLNLEQASKRPRESTKDVRGRTFNANCRAAPTKMDKDATELLKLAVLELGISPLSLDKMEKVAGTIAKLDGKVMIEAHHLSEAISYRSLDRNLWG